MGGVSIPIEMSLLEESLVRIAVGAIALPIVGVLLWLGGAWSAALFATGGAIAAYEYYRLTELRAAGVRWIGIIAATALPALAWAAPATWPEAALGVLMATSVASWMWLLFRGPRGDAPVRAGLVVGGVVFVSSGLVALAVLRARPDGMAWSAAVLIASWANDTGAFFGGKLLGRRRLLAAVSPGKTWEGLVAGAATGVGAMITVRPWLATLSLGDTIAVGLIAAVLGPIGDLCKSMIKRAAGVKDAGKIFLAHGGMLDRIDAILLNAPATLVYVLVRKVLFS